MLCLLYATLASDNVLSQFLDPTDGAETRENPQPDRSVNDPYRWGRHIFDGPIPLRSFGDDAITESLIYLLHLAERLLGVG